MPEPIDPIVRAPMGGWSKAALRLELVGVETLYDAAYHLAGLARASRMGVVATFQGRDLYAYPHQTTAEIQNGFARMRQMEDAGSMKGLEPTVARWTAARKFALVFAVREGLIARFDVQATYGVSDEELAGWERRTAAFGCDGLKSTKLQALALPAEIESAA